MTRAKRALLDTAARVFSENPGASLGDIATEAGVGRATLHRHFASRDDLIRVLTSDAYEQIDVATGHIAARATSATQALQMVIEAVVPLGDKLHFLLTQPTSTGDPARGDHDTAQERELAQLIDLVKAEGGLARDIPTAWATAAIDALIYAAWSATARGRIAERDASALVLDTLLAGLGPRQTGAESRGPDPHHAANRSAAAAQ